MYKTIFPFLGFFSSSRISFHMHSFLFVFAVLVVFISPSLFFPLKALKLDHWVQIADLPVTTCMSLGSLLNLSESKLPHLSNEEKE